MNNKPLLAALLAAAGAFATVPALAAQQCSVTDTVVNAVACFGAASFVGNNENLAAFDSYVPGGTGSWSLLDKTDALNDPAGIGFDMNTSTIGPTGTLTFTQAITGWFAVSLKAGSNYSVYLFNGGNTGISSITYDMIGTAVNRNGVTQQLSHASLWGVTPVPEPGTYALLLAGLGLVGFAARRNRLR